jgi:glycosyltransferase involved in cell wall biosynthesis
MSNPFFSIIIPTYNKSEDLKNAINSVLKQTYKDYELIVSDNHSADKTQQLVHSYKEKRIKYFRNKKNIGWIANLEFAIANGKGKYILFQGDDDYMYSKDSLKNLYKLLKNKEYGFIRLNYLSNKNGIIFDFKKNKLFSKDVSLIPNKNNDEIFDFIQKVDPYFLTGICFRNKFPKKIDFINSELAPWFKIIFYNTKNGGAYYCSKYFFIAKWVSKKSHPFYLLKNNQFTFENYLNEVSKVIKEKEFDEFRRKLFSQIISSFPLAKLNTGSKNLMNCSRRLLNLFPKYKYSFVFWIFLVMSILTPKFILKIMRQLFLINIIRDKPEIKYLSEI